MNRRFIGLVGALVTAMGGGLMAAAGPAQSAGSLTLAGHCSTTGGPWAPGGFTAESFSTPAVGDLYGNGTPWMVVGEPDGTVRWWDPSCDVHSISLGGKVESSPVLVDLNHDGYLDVVVATLTGRVVAFTPALGNRVIFNVRTRNGNFATPAVGDLLGNGQLDVVEPSFDQHLYAWSPSGRLLRGWPVFVGDTIMSSPAIADLDNSGRPEVIFGFDCAGVQGQWCFPQHGGYVGVVRNNGSWVWKHFFNGQVVWSSPAVAALTASGRPDIVVGTGNMPCNPAPGQTPNCGGYAVYALDSSGHMLPGWPVATHGRTMSSPAVGDVLGNGHLQVAIADDKGYLYLINGTGGRPVWVKCIYAACPGTGPHSSASIGDLFNDGQQEVVASGEGATALYAFTGSGASVPLQQWSTLHSVTSAPTLTTMNGQTAIVTQTNYYPNGASQDGGLYVAWWTSGTTLGRSAWPTFKGTSLRQGSLIDQPAPAPTAHGNTVEVYSLDRATGAIGVQSGRAGSFSGLSDLAAPSTSAPSVVRTGGSTYLFVRGQNGQIYYCALSGSACSAQSLGGFATSAPAAALLADGTIQLAVRAANAGAYTGNLNPSSGAFTGWRSVGGTLIGQPALASLGTGNQVLIAATGSNRVVYIKTGSGTSFGATWLKQGGVGVYGPSALAATQGSVLLFVTGVNHAIYQRGCTATGCTGSWSAPWGGVAYSAPGVYTSGGTVGVVVVGADNRMYTKTYSGGSFSGWSVLP